MNYENERDEEAKHAHDKKLSRKPVKLSRTPSPSLRKHDSSDASTLFQDSGKTTPAGIGDPVGVWTSTPVTIDSSAPDDDYKARYEAAMELVEGLLNVMPYPKKAGDWAKLQHIKLKHYQLRDSE